MKKLSRICIQFLIGLGLATTAAYAEPGQVPTGMSDSQADPKTNPCGETDPDCSRRLLWLLNGIHIVETKADAGVRFGEESNEFAMRFRAEGISADGMVGDLDGLIFEAVYLPEAGGLKLRFTLANTEVLFFCTDEETGEIHLPVESFFSACRPDGSIGLGATIGQFQWDQETKRRGVRWAEINAVYNFLRNGNGMEYLRKRLLAQIGVSVDTIWPGHIPSEVDLDRTTAVRLNFGVSGMLRSNNNRWEVRGYAGYRPNVTSFSDLGAEAKINLMYHLLLSRDELATIGIEAGFNYWEKPWLSMGQFASDRERRNYYLALVFRLIR